MQRVTCLRGLACELIYAVQVKGPPSLGHKAVAAVQAVEVAKEEKEEEEEEKEEEEEEEEEEEVVVVAELGTAWAILGSEREAPALRS